MEIFCKVKILLNLSKKYIILMSWNDMFFSYIYLIILNYYYIKCQITIEFYRLMKILSTTN